LPVQNRQESLRLLVQMLRGHHALPRNDRAGRKVADE
jgi:hypothetical protein